MTTRRYFGRAALGVASTVLIAACSSDTPTSPPTALQSLTAEPTITIGLPIGFVRTGYKLCYPARVYSTRGGCYSSVYLSISNTGGGTLNWTSSKNATWLKRSPSSGTAPSTMKVWIDGANLPPGSYTGKIKVWATGATNSPQTVSLNVTRY